MIQSYLYNTNEVSDFRLQICMIVEQMNHQVSAKKQIQIIISDIIIRGGQEFSQNLDSTTKLLT